MSVTDTVMRPSCFQVRPKVVPLPTRVSLPSGICVVTERLTDAYRVSKLCLRGCRWELAILQDVPNIEMDARRAIGDELRQVERSLNESVG